MTTLITGASGQFGRATVRGLLERIAPEDLVVMTRKPEKLADLAARGVSVRQGDFNDPASLRAACAGVDKMLLISASLVGSRIPQHKNAIDAAAASGVRHIVYTSYVGKDGGENPSLAVSDHRGTEALMQASGMNWTVLRNSQYIDAVVEAQAPLALKSGRWIASAADGKMAQVTRQDCVDAAVAVLTTPGHLDTTYNITGPDLLSFRQIAAIIAEIAGAPIEYVVVDDEGMYAFFDSLGIPRSAVDDQVVSGVPWSSDDMVSVEKSLRLGFMEVLTDDVERLTGHKPQSLRSFALERQADLRAAVAQ
jgi:NAD(P)H dehydrogenase (quinone)